MAERGGDEENPFSFKKFVSVKDKKPPRNASGRNQSDAVDVDDIFGLSDSTLGPPKSDKSGEEIKIAEGLQKGTVKKEKQKDNPFSFKKFLSGSVAGKKGSDPSFTSPLTAVSDLPDPLPDQVQTGNVIENHSSNIFVSSDEENGSFPTETLDCDLLANSVDPVPGNRVSSDNDLKYQHLHDSEDEDGAGGAFVGKDSSTVPLALPDFLSDAAALNSRQTSVKLISEESRGNHEDLLDQIRILQEENDRLRAELNREKQRCSDKNQRLSQLQIDLERQKKKEAEETAVMERAVQQVEENLVTTTKRAVQAETAAAKLKQEVKTLQHQVKALSAENEAYRSGDGGLSDIRERVKYTSDQLASAAVTGEKNLKELMAGVDKLKLLSQVLSSLEKVTDVQPDQTAEDDTKPS